jgi:hypothetical protein
MIFFPAGRFLTLPFPPLLFFARVLAAVILPPLLVLAIFLHLVGRIFEHPTVKGNPDKH